MKKDKKPSLRFEYIEFDPKLFYDPTRSESENQEHLLDVQWGSNLSGFYRKEFEKGNEEAIFEYAEWFSCFQSPWVTDQIEKWRVDNSPESRNKLKRFFKVYTGDARGRVTLQETIKRDQNIFYEILKLKKKFPKESMEDIVARIARKLKSKDPNLKNEETISLIYKKYKKVADEWSGRRSDRFKDKMEFIEYFMKTSLDDILKRSRELDLSMDYRCSRCQKRVVLKSERKSSD